MDANNNITQTTDYPHLSLENLMTCLLEEASEVAKAMSKAKRFGLDDHPPIAGAVTNKTKMEFELGDLLGVMHLIQREYCLSEAFILEISKNKEDKIRENYGKRFAP